MSIITRFCLRLVKEKRRQQSLFHSFNDLLKPWATSVQMRPHIRLFDNIYLLCHKIRTFLFDRRIDRIGMSVLLVTCTYRVMALLSRYITFACISQDNNTFSWLNMTHPIFSFFSSYTHTYIKVWLYILCCFSDTTLLYSCGNISLFWLVSISYK